MKPTYEGGTTHLEGWEPAAVVTHIDQIEPGQILLLEDHQFKAQNLCRVTRVSRERGLVYGVFVDPADTAKPRLPNDREFGLWDFDISNAKRTRLLKVLSTRSPAPPPGVYHQLRDTAADLIDMLSRVPARHFPEDDRARLEATAQRLRELVFIGERSASVNDASATRSARKAKP
jgi:hypothetical protein